MVVACAPCIAAAASNPVTAPFVLPVAAVSAIGYYKYNSPKKGSKKKSKRKIKFKGSKKKKSKKNKKRKSNKKKKKKTKQRGGSVKLNKKKCCKCRYVKSGKSLRRVRGPYPHCSYDSDNCCKDKKTIVKSKN